MKKDKNQKKRTDKKDLKERKKGAPKWKRVIDEIEKLQSRIEQETPPQGVMYYRFKQEGDEEKKEETRQQDRQILDTTDKTKIKIRFSDLPVTKSTISGLFKSKFIKMTETQRATIPHALSGRDVVACARTGSGKTLSYLIPVIEKLYRERWTQLDGLGALILVPTRELGIQAYEVLRQFGSYHEFSAGLVIGGKDVNKEKEIIRSMNILICTPGRLQQHMDETALFNADNLKILVLDEVDRLMDMGFKESLESIVQNLPNDVQTLMFSATIGKKIKDLMKVNLKKDHEYICIHDYAAIENKQKNETPDEEQEKLKSITPVKLLHYYMVLKIEEKLDTLFSFIKSHPKSKILVFFSARKQVRYAYQAFKSLKCGVNLFELHGKQEQNKRTAIFFQFMEKKSAILFATDIASRGVDFPAVDWVIQYDCPEDINTYIHRVGRSARHKAKGNALLFLLPSEKAFVDKITSNHISVQQQRAAPNRQLTIKQTLQKLNAENNDMMHLAQRACVSYLKCVHLMKDKTVFKLKEVDADKLAESLGLAGTPKIDFGQDENEVVITNTMSRAEQRQARVKQLREQAKQRKEQKKKQMWEEVSEGESIDGDGEKEEKQEEKPHSVENEDSDDSDDSDDIMVKVDPSKQTFKDDDDTPAEEFKVNMKQALKKAAHLKIKSDGMFQGKNRQVLDKDGKPILDPIEALRQSNSLNLLEETVALNMPKTGYLEKAKEKIEKQGKEDKQKEKERIKQQRLKKKRQMGKVMREDESEEMEVRLATPEESEDGYVSEEKPKKRQKKEKKEKKEMKAKTAEERALELLDQDF